MAVNLSKNNLCINQIIEQKNEKITIESDEIVPDIKPDVLSIISSSGNICLHKKEVQDGKVRIEGTVNAYVVYIADDENSSMRAINANIDFSKNIEMKELKSSMQLECTTDLTELECKIINGRKISLKANIQMNLTAYSNENVEIVNGTTKMIGFVMMNMNEEYGGPVSNPDVQKAIRKALDYSGIRMICGDGTLTPYSIIQDGFMGSKGTRPDDYTNIEEAKQLLADAGYPDGFDVDMTVSDLDMEGILLTDLAQKVKDDLSQIGINVNITTEAWAAGYGDAYRNGTLGFTVMYWGVDYSDPNVQLEFLPGGTVGLRGGWTAEMNPELAAMSQEAMEATDNDARTQVLENIQDAMYEDGPFIVIAQAPAHIAHSTRLDGVDIFDSYTIDLTAINVK